MVFMPVVASRLRHGTALRSWHLTVSLLFRLQVRRLLLNAAAASAVASKNSPLDATGECPVGLRMFSCCTLQPSHEPEAPSLCCCWEGYCWRLGRWLQQLSRAGVHDHARPPHNAAPTSSFDLTYCCSTAGAALEAVARRSWTLAFNPAATDTADASAQPAIGVPASCPNDATDGLAKRYYFVQLTQVCYSPSSQLRVQARVTERREVVVAR